MNDEFNREITAYMQEYSPVSTDEIQNHLLSLGVKCSLKHVRSHLRSLGLAPQHSSEKRWLWYPAKSESEAEAEKTSEVSKPDAESEALTRIESANQTMLRERTILLEALQKTATLRKEIKTAQEKLLLEIANLIHSTYGAREAEEASEAD